MVNKKKIFVHKMPDTPSDCPFSKWKAYPPGVGLPGYYICPHNNDEPCNLKDNGCYFLKKSSIHIPKAPFVEFVNGDKHVRRITCPNCHQTDVQLIDSYCSNCGQALDWESCMPCFIWNKEKKNGND